MAVRAVMGEPLFASTAWGFDLFVAQTEQSDVIVAVTPWPVPFARIKDLLQRYTLVAYDADERAAAVDSGVFRRPAPWRNVSPLAPDFRALHLRAGELMFYADPEGARRENLLAAPAARDTHLRRLRAAPGCTVVLGCGERGCGDQLAIDDAPPRRLALRSANAYWLPAGQRDTWLHGVAAPSDSGPLAWLETLVAVSLPAGEHRLAFSAKHLGGKTTLPLACRAGEVSYLEISASDNGSFANRALVDWQVQQSQAMPAGFAWRPLVLLDDGQWQVEADATASPR